MRKIKQSIPIGKLALNEGQIDWLPRNPRQWTKDDIERMIKSLDEDPDFMEDRPPLVTPQKDGGFCVFAGNERTEAERKRKKRQEIEVVVYYPESDEDRETVIRRAIKDNGHFGSWDADILANEWDVPLEDWGVPDWVTGDYGNGKEGTSKNDAPEKIDFVENLLQEAMRENVREAVEQIDHMMKRGWITSWLTKGAVQAQFLRAKYYGKHYSQWLSLYFCPQRFMTSANKTSVYDQMRLVAAGGDAGIAGFRTISEDGPLNVIQKSGYPIGGSRMPLDFPANKAFELIKEFGGDGCSVLDPCHGWGGRLTGALMADVSLYCGIDPSPFAHDGVQKAANAFLPYCKGSRVELIQKPFEDVNLDKRVFDMAITSPPYFDVEQYAGDLQSHARYENYDRWVECFYKVLIEKTYAVLRSGGVFVLNVGSKSYPLLDDGTRLALAAGFVVEEIRPFGGSTSSALHGNDDDDPENEKIIILRKGANR